MKLGLKEKGVSLYPWFAQEERRRKKKKKKPPTKDFSCSDCGKAFYFQKNLFTHVVEKHGKSVDELPNLALVKTEDGLMRTVLTQSIYQSISFSLNTKLIKH